MKVRIIDLSRRLLVPILMLCVLLAVQTPVEAAPSYNGFNYSVDEGNATIVYYTGAATDVTIPSEIVVTESLRYPVVRVGNEIGSVFSSRPVVRVTVPSSVRRISTRAFSGSGELTTVNLPSTLESIGVEAFNNCYKLAAVSIPSGVKRIENRTFAYCVALQTISIPYGLESIGQEAFNGCTLLRNGLDDLPLSLEWIEDRAFQMCYFLADVGIPDSVGFIGNDAFQGTAWIEALSHIPELTIVGNGLLVGYGGTAAVLQLPDTVKRICSQSFLGSTTLRNVIIADGCRSISARAFSGCRELLQFTIPASCITIHPDAFVDLASSSLIITGYHGTVAETFAIENFHMFLALATIHFDSVGGTAIPSSIVGEGIATIFEPTPPVRAGHQFDGWYPDTAYLVPWDFPRRTYFGTTTLFAKWRLPEPVGVRAIRTAADSARLSWNPQNGATGYDVYRKRDTESSFRLIGTSNSQPFLDTGLEADSTYQYKVRAFSVHEAVRFDSADSPVALLSVFTGAASPSETPSASSSPPPSEDATPSSSATPSTSAQPTLTAAISGTPTVPEGDTAPFNPLWLLIPALLGATVVLVFLFRRKHDRK